MNTSLTDSNNIPWIKYQFSLIPNRPPHVLIETHIDEIISLMKEAKTLLARWPSNWDSERETSFWAVIKDEFGGFDELSSNTRSKVRRGLKHSIVKKLDRDSLIKTGYETYLKAFDRYDSYLKPKDRKTFINDIRELDDNWEFWGVINKSNQRLIAFAQNWLFDGAVEYKIIKFDPEYMKVYPSYALFYEMNRYYLEEKQYRYVNDGYRSIAHKTNIQDFLIGKFKFRRAYCDLHVEFRNPIKFILLSLLPFKPLLAKSNIRIIQRINALLQLELLRIK